MSKKDLSERDICTQFITPAITAPGKWDLTTQVREEVSFTNGRILVRGKLVTRGNKMRADYILYHRPNRPLAIIEAKDNSHSVGSGMQQALEYAKALDIPFVYSSNGDAFLEHDLTAKKGIVEREIPLDQFPSPDELWTRYCAAKNLTPKQELIATQNYYADGSGKAPRLLPNGRHQPHGRRRCSRPEASVVGHGHRHRKNLHGVSDHLALVEIRGA